MYQILATIIGFCLGISYVVANKLLRRHRARFDEYIIVNFLITCLVVAGIMYCLKADRREKINRVKPDSQLCIVNNTDYLIFFDSYNVRRNASRGMIKLESGAGVTFSDYPDFPITISYIGRKGAKRK
jgi:hypothetical protein